MSGSPPEPGLAQRRGGFPVHPVDLLVLVLAAGLAALAYAYLFRTSPIPRPVDPLLGVEIEVEFPLDRPWKEEFPVVGQSVLLNEYLTADVLERTPFSRDGSPGARVTLRIRDRNTQKPEAMTQFRTGVRRGTYLLISDPHSEVGAEVTRVGSGAEEE